MSNENRPDKRPRRVDSLKGVAYGTAILSTALGTGIASHHAALEEINRHILTPAAVRELIHETGATLEDVSQLEKMLKALLQEEMARILARKVK